MDINLWKKKGIVSKSTGLIIAPEDFKLEREEILTGVEMESEPDEITISPKHKEFFTYHEAVAAGEQGQFPRGWRLPTIIESAAIVAEFTEESDETSLGFAKELQLDFDGYVYPDMNDYNNKPSSAHEAIRGRYLEGRFWVDSPDGKSPHAILIKRQAPPKLQTLYAGSGAKIRLVYDPHLNS